MEFKNKQELFDFMQQLSDNYESLSQELQDVKESSNQQEQQQNQDENEQNQDPENGGTPEDATGGGSPDKEHSDEEMDEIQDFLN